MLGDSHDSVSDRGMCTESCLDLYGIRRVSDASSAVYLLSGVLGRNISGPCDYVCDCEKEDGILLFTGHQWTVKMGYR